MKRIKEWECEGCGHRMTATTEIREGGLVKDDDPSEAGAAGDGSMFMYELRNVVRGARGGVGAVE